MFNLKVIKTIIIAMFLIATGFAYGDVCPSKPQFVVVEVILFPDKRPHPDYGRGVDCEYAYAKDEETVFNEFVRGKFKPTPAFQDVDRGLLYKCNARGSSKCEFIRE